jgi:hypothetical protein
MISNFRVAVLITLTAGTAACTTVTLAPGADRVRLTVNATDISSCRAVGSVKAPQGSGLDGEPTIRNQALGLGANVIFVTRNITGSEEGVAYNCP